MKIKLYGHNSSRPGFPDQWYGVKQWRTTEHEAKDDMWRQAYSNKQLGIVQQHRIETCEVEPKDTT